MITAVMIGGCTSLPKQVPREASHALTNTSSTKIGQALSSHKATHPGLSGFYLLDDGVDAFVARAVIAERAERSIDAQYYLYHGDLIGQLFTAQLVNAADRGVRVRLLVDDMALNSGDASAVALNAHPNIEVRIFNPFFRNTPRTAQFVARFGAVTRRMHNKSLTVDNQITVVGGRNIGNEYFDANLQLFFGDLDVVAIGPVVDAVSGSFDLYWNHQLAYPIESLARISASEFSVENLREKVARFTAEQVGSDYLKALRESELADALRRQAINFVWGDGTVVHDNPDKITADRNRKDLHLASQIEEYTSNVRKDLIILSPYFVPGKDGVDWLTGLRRKGVRVRILTNSLASTDVSIVHAGYARYRKSLLRAGIELWEYDKQLTRKQRKALKATGGSSKASLHAKSFVIDNERIFIGSLNIDPRSIVENTELGIMIESEAIAAEMVSLFDRLTKESAFRLSLESVSPGRDKIIWHGLEGGSSRIYTNEPHAGFWRRLSVKFLQWLPIESQL